MKSLNQSELPYRVLSINGGEFANLEPQTNIVGESNFGFGSKATTHAWGIDRPLWPIQ